MDDQKLFYEDAGLSRLETEVIEVGEEAGRPFVRLRETLFFPEGGGQPADRGTIGEAKIIDVQSRGTAVLHFLDRPLPVGPAVALLDAVRRSDFRQQHSGQHLLSAILDDRHGLPTTGFHLGDTYTAIEVAGEVPDTELLRRMEAEVNTVIRENRPVRARVVARDEFERLDVRTRGLPEEQTESIRLIEIEGIDLNTCCGTHVESLAEIQAIHLLDAVPARGGARIRFLCGDRVFDRLAEVGTREEELKALLSTPPEEFARVVGNLFAERQTLTRKTKRLADQLAEHVGAELATQPRPRIVARLQDADPDFLKRVATAVTERRPEALVLLVGESDEGEACFLVQSGPEGPEDVAEEGARLRDALGARGGGRGRFFQGAKGKVPADFAFDD